MEDDDVPLCEDVVPAATAPCAVEQRTKIVFADSSDDESTAAASRVEVVQPLYHLTTDAGDLEASSDDDEQGVEGMENGGDEAALGGFGALAAPAPLFLGADALRRYRGGLGGMGSLLGGGGDGEVIGAAPKPRRGRVADRPTTDETFLDGKRTRFEADDGEAEGHAPAAAASGDPAGLQPYRLTLVEADVQEVFSSDDEADPLADLDGDADLDADEEEEERFDRMVAVAAIAEAVRVCEEDDEFKADRRYQAFAAKAKTLLEQLDSDAITDEAFLGAIAGDMAHLKRLHARTMKPPKDAPIVINGVVMDL